MYTEEQYICACMCLIYVYVCIHLCMSAFMCVCIYIYMYICIVDTIARACRKAGAKAITRTSVGDAVGTSINILYILRSYSLCMCVFDT